MSDKTVRMEWSCLLLAARPWKNSFRCLHALVNVREQNLNKIQVVITNTFMGQARYCALHSVNMQLAILILQCMKQQASFHRLNSMPGTLS